MKFLKNLKDSKQIITRIKLVLLILVCIGLAFIDIRSISAIGNIGAQTYYVQPKTAAYQEVIAEQTYTMEVEAIGNQMLALGLEVKMPKDADGIIQYDIASSTGQVLVKDASQKINTSGLDENGRYWLGVDGIHLKQGQSYTISYVVTDVTGLEINMSDKQPVIMQSFEFEHQKMMYLILAGINILAGVFLFLFFKYGLSNKLYILVFLCVGIVLSLLTPPMSSADEYRHFLRVYDLATNGQYAQEMKEIDADAVGLCMPNGNQQYSLISIPEDISQLRLVSYNDNINDNSYQSEVNTSLCLNKLQNILSEKESSTRVWAGETSTDTRSGLCYWDQVLFVWLGIVVGVRSLYLYYLAKIGQVIICTLIGWLCLRLCSRQKNMIWLVSFIPMSMTYIASASSDGLLISEIMLVISLVYAMREKEVKILSIKGGCSILVILLLMLNIAVIKVPYVLCCIFAILFLSRKNIPVICKQYKKNKIVFCITIAVCAAIVLAFIYVKRDMILPMLNQFLPQEHLEYMKSYPMEVARLFASKWKNQVHELYNNISGGFYVPYAVVIFVTMIFSKRVIPIWKQIYAVIAFSLLVMVIVLAGFTLTPPDYAMSNGIWGITARYYLPFLPFIVAAFPCGTEKTQKQVEELYPIFVLGMLAANLIQSMMGNWIR